MRKYWYSIVLTLSIAGMALGDTFTNQMGDVSANPMVAPGRTESGGNKGKIEMDAPVQSQPWMEQAETEELVEIHIKSAENEGSGEDEEGAEDVYSKVSIESVEGERSNQKNGLAKTLIEQARRAPAGAVYGENQQVDNPKAAGAEAGSAQLNPTADFSGTLFIGDSRTVGLSEYGQLGQAEVFADSGMSVYNVLSQQVTLRRGGKKTLDEVLSERQYQFIYVMLGINELGYEYSETLARYETVVDRIKEAQPGSVLALEANLHVTQEKSSRAAIITNEKINAINGDIKKLADRKGCLYIDVNPLFDDESGSLDDAYSTDGAHILGKYYTVWAEWIRNGGTAAASD